jgi:hypothetical protein
MKSKLALAVMLAAGSVAPRAFPCGAPFGNGINVDPKQDIIVVHKDNVETYVFQPRFCGSASSFGLILPVPSMLSAAPALSKSSVFTLLNEITKPRVVTSTVCLGSRTASVGGSAPTNGGGTTVVSTGSVGFMDYAQLKADSVTSFTAWLDANGYPYDDLALSAFSYYVEKGWYFVAFKVSQGVAPTTDSCKDLGPIKLSFPTTIPVVPTRMATARAKDTSGALANASSFSWRIFGINTGKEQLGFTDGSNYMRTSGYSGLLTEGNASQLDGLAQAGDRLNKLIISFNYGSTDPDIALTKVSGYDYQETTYSTNYITCDAGMAPSPDAGPSKDADVKRDTGSTPLPATSTDSGCSISASTGPSSFIPLLFLALAIAILRRRR